MVEEIKKGVRKGVIGFYISLVIFVVFLALWLLTLPKVAEVPEPSVNESENLTADELIKQVEEEHKVILDDSNYYRAISNNNSVFCEFVNDEVLKEDCFNKTIYH